jgi:hypothetical protein
MCKNERNEIKDLTIGVGNDNDDDNEVVKRYIVKV